MNPNFPINLDIHPSASPSHLQDVHLDPSYGLSSQEDAIRQYGIAGRVWEAAYAMTLFVNPPPDLEVDPPFLSRGSLMIELGSGSGFVASHISKLLQAPDHLVVTDLPEVCPLLKTNLNGINTVSVRPLAWGNEDDVRALSDEFFTGENDDQRPPYFSYIICSDLVYFPELLGPLLRSLIHLSPPTCSPLSDDRNSETPLIYISYKIRSLAKESMFWSAFGLWFDFRPVLVKNKRDHEEWKRFGCDFPDATFLFVAARRPESHRWKIPTQDSDLLTGVGACGTNLRKGDDTFENILLMSLQQD